MGIPFHNNLMPVIHIFPISDKRTYIRTEEVLAGQTTAGPFDFAASYHFLNMSLNSDGLECTLEFIDPTFHDFEKVLEQVGRKTGSPLLGSICFEIRVGWVAGGTTTETDILYPKERDLELRVSGGGNKEGRLTLVGGELLSEPFWVRMTNMQYSVQNTGVRYTMKGPFNWQYDQTIFSQADDVMPEGCTYLTLLYTVASKMNVMIYFDSTVNQKLLFSKADKFTFHNEKHIDTLARILEIMKEPEIGLPLQVSVSNSPKDAELAANQMRDLYGTGGTFAGQFTTDTTTTNTSGNDIVNNNQQQQLKNFSGGIGRFFGEVLVRSTGTPIFAMRAATIIYNYAHNTIKNIQENITSAEEKTKLQDAVNSLLKHYLKIFKSEVKAMKTYRISGIPNVMNTKNAKISPTGVTDPLEGYPFLGIYTHFGKDLESLTATANGIETSMATLMATSITIDETIYRFTQNQKYTQIIENTGIVLTSLINLYKLAYTNSLTAEQSKSLLAGIDPALLESNGVKSTYVGVRGEENKFADTLKSSIGTVILPQPLNLWLNQVHAQEASKTQSLLNTAINREWLNNAMSSAIDLPPTTDTNVLLEQSGQKLDEIMKNPYSSDADIQSYFQEIDDIIANKVTTSINLDAKTLKALKQVTKIKLANQIFDARKESLKEGAGNVRYNRECINLTLKVVGDVALICGSYLLGRSFLYLQFYNPKMSDKLNSTDPQINQFLTGYYRLMNFRHDLSANALFTTELTLLGHDFKGVPPTGGLNAGFTNINNTNWANPLSITGVYDVPATDINSVYRSFGDNLTWQQQGGLFSMTQKGETSTWSTGENFSTTLIDTMTQEAQPK